MWLPKLWRNNQFSREDSWRYNYLPLLFKAYKPYCAKATSKEVSVYGIRHCLFKQIRSANEPSKDGTEILESVGVFENIQGSYQL